MYIVFHGLLSLAVHQSHLKIFCEMLNPSLRLCHRRLCGLGTWCTVSAWKFPGFLSLLHILLQHSMFLPCPQHSESSTGLHAEDRSLDARFSNSPLAEGELHNGLDSKEPPNVSIVRFLPVNSVPSTYCQLTILPILVCPLR